MQTSHAPSGIRTHHPSTYPGHGSHQTAGALTHSATMLVWKWREERVGFITYKYMIKSLYFFPYLWQAYIHISKIKLLNPNAQFRSRTEEIFCKQKQPTPSLFIDCCLIEFCHRIHWKIPFCTNIHRKTFNIL